MLKRKCSFHNLSWNKKKTKFCSATDSISVHQKANVIYEVICPGCNKDYVGETIQDLVTRLNKNASREDQPMYQNLSKYQHFTHIIDLLRLPDINASTTKFTNKQHFVNTIISNFYVLGNCCNWFELLFLEVLYIKNLAPKISDGWKSNTRACFISIERQVTYIDL